MDMDKVADRPAGQNWPAGAEWFDFDTLVVPFDLGFYDFTPPPDMWERYRKFMEDDQVFITNAFRPRAMSTYRLLAPRPNALHINATHEAEYFGRPVPGKKLTIHSVIIEKYIRRDKKYIVTETELKDEDGRLIERLKRHSMVESAKLGEKWWAKPTAATEIGAVLDPLVKTITFEMMREFEAVYGLGGGRTENFHSNEKIAKAAGFKRPIASAHMTVGYMHSLLDKFFGHDWVKGGTLNLKHIRPVMAGDTVTYSGVVKDKQPEQGRTRLIVELWAENQEGKKTTVGSASGLVD